MDHSDQIAQLIPSRAVISLHKLIADFVVYTCYKTPFSPNKTSTFIQEIKYYDSVKNMYL